MKKMKRNRIHYSLATELLLIVCEPLHSGIPIAGAVKDRNEVDAFLLTAFKAEMMPHAMSTILTTGSRSTKGDRVRRWSAGGSLVR